MPARLRLGSPLARLAPRASAKLPRKFAQAIPWHGASGRSHRAKESLVRICEVISRSREVLGVPKDFRVAIVPASDTGAFEMAMWSLLGERGVDFFTWENFGDQWVIDGETQLRPLDCRIFRAPYGELPDLSQA